MLAALCSRAVAKGIDLESPQPLRIEAANVEEAVAFCCLLSHTRGCDLFRGQRREWRPIPSQLRLPDAERRSARWPRFRDWAGEQESITKVASDPRQLWAIAQHYGMPSQLLDVSANPRVAAYFATGGAAPEPEANACIFCINGGSLAAGYHHAPGWIRSSEAYPALEKIEVDGLFRMQAQEGAFVYVTSDAWTSFFAPDVVCFPPRNLVSSPGAADLFPQRKSEVELLAERYFASEAP
jgi:hypothetical protein